MRTRLSILLVTLFVFLPACGPTEKFVVAPSESSPSAAEHGMAAESGGVNVISVTANPASVKPGERVELVVDYLVGAASGKDVDVQVTVEVRYDSVLKSMPTYVKDVRPGRQEARVRLNVPPDAKSGEYEVDAYVSAGEEEDVGEGAFIVQ